MLVGARLTDRPFKIQGKAYQVDIAQPEQVEATIDQIVRDFNGRLDIFVANSGMVWSEGAAIDSSVAHYREVLSTNLDGVYYCARVAGQHWRRQAAEKTTVSGEELTGFNGGSFIATASMSGHIVNVPHIQAAYNTSKAGVIHLCKA
jgi:sorbose reductase